MGKPQEETYDDFTIDEDIFFEPEDPDPTPYFIDLTDESGYADKETQRFCLRRVYEREGNEAKLGKLYFEGLLPTEGLPKAGNGRFEMYYYSKNGVRDYRQCFIEGEITKVEHVGNRIYFTSHSEGEYCLELLDKGN